MYEVACFEAITTAGQVLMKHFGKTRRVARKEDHSSIVTEADGASETAIINILRHAYPNQNLIAEESGFVDNGSEFTWVIDPLDGTSNYAAGLPWFGVLVALLEGNRPILGAMYLPWFKTMYICQAGHGVLRDGERVHLTAETDPRNVLCAYGLDASPDEAKTRREATMLARLVNGVRNVRATNSLLDFCYTLDGRLGAVINQNTKIWDIAPACLMFAESGGLLTDLAGRPLTLAVGADYDRSYAVVGTSRALHPKILEILKG